MLSTAVRLEIHALITVLGGLCQQGRQAVRYDGGWGTVAGWCQSTPNAGGGGDGAGVVGEEDSPWHAGRRPPRASWSGCEVVIEDTDDGSAALALC
jgi:hypothetical protein